MSKKAFKDLKYRVPIAVAMSAVALLLIYFSYNPVVQFVIALALTLIVTVGTLEWETMMAKKRLKIHRNLTIGFAAFWMLSTYLTVIGFDMISFNLFIIGLYSFLLFLMSFRFITNSIQSISVNFFGVAYVVVPLSLILFIASPSSLMMGDDGRVWLAYLVVVTKITDIGGYFVGKMWGRHKLAPQLSPKKTFEGAFGGLALALIASIGFYFFGEAFEGIRFSLSIGQAIFLGIVLSILGQLGDLSESLFKRDSHMKDSNTIPGFGGVLDMFDSLIFTTPALFLFMRIV